LSTRFTTAAPAISNAPQKPPAHLHFTTLRHRSNNKLAYDNLDKLTGTQYGQATPAKHLPLSKIRCTKKPAFGGAERFMQQGFSELTGWK
jgi:hypothetical protein